MTTALDDTALPGDPLPRWDLSPLFPTVAGPEVTDAEQRLKVGVFDLRELYDRHEVRGGGARPSDDAADEADIDVAAFDAVLAATNDVLELYGKLQAFAYLHVR